MSNATTPVAIKLGSLPADVATRLLNVGPTLNGREVLILPTQTRDGTTHYGEFDIYAVKTARVEGLNADYLLPTEERKYVHEYSAEWLVIFAVAVAHDLGITSIKALGSYVYRRAREAVTSGRHSGPVGAVPTRIELTRTITQTPQGNSDTTTLIIEGDADSSARTAMMILSTQPGNLQLPAPSSQREIP